MKGKLMWLIACVVAAGCARDDTARMDQPMTADTAAESAPAAPAQVTDPQIAAIVVAANEVDIEAGELARERATNPQVRQFAERMVTDHTAANQQAQELAGRLGVTPEESPTSQQLRQGGQQNLERLRGLSGAEFDRAYIEHEVAYHQQVLDAIDNTLIPNAQNPELRSLLEQTRPVIEAHLNQARQLEGTLRGS